MKRGSRLKMSSLKRQCWQGNRRPSEGKKRRQKPALSQGKKQPAQMVQIRLCMETTFPLLINSSPFAVNPVLEARTQMDVLISASSISISWPNPALQSKMNKKAKLIPWLLFLTQLTILSNSLLKE